ncbi:MAG: hypothetical protein ACOC2L_03860 [Candidatus Sumerlaeota bacterium]
MSSKRGGPAGFECWSWRVKVLIFQYFNPFSLTLARLKVYIKPTSHGFFAMHGAEKAQANFMGLA